MFDASAVVSLMVGAGLFGVMAGIGLLVRLSRGERDGHDERST